MALNRLINRGYHSLQPAFILVLLDIHAESRFVMEPQCFAWQVLYCYTQWLKGKTLSALGKHPTNEQNRLNTYLCYVCCGVFVDFVGHHPDNFDCHCRTSSHSIFVVIENVGDCLLSVYFTSFLYAVISILVDLADGGGTH